VCARITFSSKSTIEFVAAVNLLDVSHSEEKLIQKNKIVIPLLLQSDA